MRHRATGSSPQAGPRCPLTRPGHEFVRARAKRRRPPSLADTPGIASREARRAGVGEEKSSSSLGDRRAPSISPAARWRRAGRPSIADIRATHYVRSHSNAPSIAPAVLCRRHPFNSPRMSVPPPSSDGGLYSKAPRRRWPAARNRSASALQAEPRWMDAKRTALVGEESGRLGFRMARLPGQRRGLRRSAAPKAAGLRGGSPALLFNFRSGPPFGSFDSLNQYSGCRRNSSRLQWLDPFR